MTSEGLSNFGEEWEHKLAFRQDLITRDTTIEVLLYNDSTDALTDSSDVGDITTEPTDGNYTRQTFTLDSADVTLAVEGGDLRAEATVTFDVTGTTGTVDASACVVSFQSDVVNSETAQNPHHIYSASLTTPNGDPLSADLSAYTSLESTVALDLA